MEIKPATGLVKIIAIFYFHNKNKLLLRSYQIYVTQTMKIEVKYFLMNKINA